MPNVTKTKAALAKTAQSKVESMFQPFEINGIQFRNRILAPPSVADQADLDGRVTPALIKYYRTLARQGVGTIIVESAYVTKQGRGHVNQLGISEEEHLEGLGNLARGVKKEGASIGIRISHAGAQTSASACGASACLSKVFSSGSSPFSVAQTMPM